MKRFVALLLICVMVFGLLSASVLAADGVDSPEPEPTTEESPQTGVGGNLMIIGFVMIAALAVAGVAIKKARS